MKEKRTFKKSMQYILLYLGMGLLWFSIVAYSMIKSGSTFFEQQ